MVESFVIDNPQRTSYLYFPLVNEAGMMSSITPMLHGDAKTGQNSYLLAPVSVEDLHNTRSARNFWAGTWSATGNSAPQRACNDEKVVLEAGFLWHKITRENAEIGLRAEIVNFVPPSEDQVELMRVNLTNISDQPITFAPIAAIPIYGRSADNLRDHRHVTSLLHRITTHPNGVCVQPCLSFDERGHKPNAIIYSVLGTGADGTAPISFYPVLEDFIGEGGDLEWPAAVVSPESPGVPAGTSDEGYEAIGALRFADCTLNPGQTQTYILMLAIHADPDRIVRTYGKADQFDSWWVKNRAYWQEKIGSLSFETGDPGFGGWMQWVTLQPVLRRLFGNSFLPYHDYGRGGRGWRDLWQDCLALLLMEPAPVRDLLISNYAGVRIDGSNATIIGSKPGEFVADRNNIPRVWMDHGAWPYLTTRLYLDQSGDLDLLLREQTYFKDKHIQRAKAHDTEWMPDQGTQLRTQDGTIYTGTILEHILVQHLTVFFNVGEHNIIRLEGADWNDGLDMASVRGESVAFTGLYASNLRDLSQLLSHLSVDEVELADEIVLLLDTLNAPVDYDSIPAKLDRLQAYFASVPHTVSGKKARVSVSALAQDLAAKADWIYEHLRAQEWLDEGWFNGYYDNDGARVEGGSQMTLTGQVFAIMGGIATDNQTRTIVQAADRNLYEASMGGYRLNTDFGGVRLNLGRCFGFAFGHKENGAMFSHMTVMYANALYQRGFVREGFKALDSIYQHCCNFDVAKIYPGIPEYISARGRGMYTYLTGSASWFLLTLVNEVFGVKGRLGDLVLEPKLVAEQFDAQGEAQIRATFAGRRLVVTYRNPNHLDTYTIRRVTLDGADTESVLPRATLEQLDPQTDHQIIVDLG